MGTPRTPADENGPGIDLDLGFGKFVSSKSRRRLLNRDGTFNVWARFGSMFDHDEAAGYLSVDLARIHDVVPAPLGGASGRPTAGNAES